MQYLIASYLFQHAHCPLPGMGSLSIVSKPSASDFVHKLMIAPTPVIRFTEKELDASKLIQFVAEKLQVDTEAGIRSLRSFCKGLKVDAANGSVAGIEGVGSFAANSFGELLFKQQEFPAAFAASVKAERVIHPQATHTVLVGDNETTSTIMASYYTEEETKKDHWWVWAIVLAAIAITAIVLYFNDPAHSSLFGNAVSYKLA